MRERTNVVVAYSYVSSPPVRKVSCTCAQLFASRLAKKRDHAHRLPPSCSRLSSTSLYSAPAFFWCSSFTSTSLQRDRMRLCAAASVAGGGVHACWDPRSGVFADGAPQDRQRGGTWQTARRMEFYSAACSGAIGCSQSTSLYTSWYVVVHGEDALERGSRCIPLPLPLQCRPGAHVDSMQCTKRLDLVCRLHRL
jgi:hypothetical protein